MDLNARLARRERDELESLMDMRGPGLDGPMQGSVTRVHGLLTSIVSGPMVMPSEWLPMIFHDPDDARWESPKQVRRAMSLIMRLHNEIASDLSFGGRQYSIIIDRICDGADALELADDWCRGYTRGIAIRQAEWKEAIEAPELQAAFLPILSIAQPTNPDLDPVENLKTYRAMVDVLPQCAVEISEWWRKRRVASK